MSKLKKLGVLLVTAIDRTNMPVILIGGVLIAGILGVVDYQVILSKENLKECLVVKVVANEEQASIRTEIPEALLRIAPIQKSIAAGSMTEPKVELVYEEAIRREGRAKRRILDQR